MVNTNQTIHNSVTEDSACIKTLKDNFQVCYTINIFGIQEPPAALIPRGLLNTFPPRAFFSCHRNSATGCGVFQLPLSPAVEQGNNNSSSSFYLLCGQYTSCVFPLEMGAWTNTSLKYSFLKQWKVLWCFGATQKHTFWLSILTYHFEI